MKLFIAEKPSLGRAIAEALGIVNKTRTHIECREGTVTWCFGHLLEQCEPEEYDESWKEWSNLPVLPSAFKLKVRKNVKEQLSAIGGLLRKAKSVVNAGDPDREGQLLVDEVLEHCQWKGPTERLWLSSLDEKSVARALASMKDNVAYKPLRDAARARSQADWLVGMNATRAMTLKGRRAGMSGVQSLGRVQTPTLALVVRRDREIAAFKPHDYFLLKANFASGYSGVFMPDETQPGVDSEGRMVDAAEADRIIAAVTGKTGEIVNFRREEKKKTPPLPHCLSSLQKAASARLSMTAQQVLDAAQRLYEARLTTYPRTDCRYLPEEQFDDSGDILKALAGIDALGDMAGNADASIKGAVWNTKKITAHHAIIPTGEQPGSDISGQTLALYEMICRAYCLQFYSPCEYQAVRIVTRVERTDWETKARVVLQPGWIAAGADEVDEDKEEGPATTLPELAAGDPVTCTEATKQAKKTTPPPAFTEGTLIEAMASIHRFIDDPEARKTLKENEGIGTEATRAGILETLKKRGFLEAKGRKLISADDGRRLIDACPSLLKDPVTTAHWETRLSAIAEGSETLDAFMQAQRELVPELIAAISEGTLKTPKGTPRCPSCGLPLLLRKSAKGSFWGCSGYPDCTERFPDDHGKPGKRSTEETEQKCPDCGGNLRKGGGEDGKKPYFLCTNKEAHGGQVKFFDEAAGVPVERKPGGEETEISCPDCGHMLQRREGQYGPYFLCVNKDAHGGKNKIWRDQSGAPVESKPRTEATKFKCPVCGGLLNHGVSKTGKPYFACFNKSTHDGNTALFWTEKNGKPVFDKDGKSTPKKK